MSKTSNPPSRVSSIGGSVPEKIMQQLRQMYTEPHCGLLELAALVGIPLLAPREKITVLLVGNHSAGKSSFINWYIEEHIQRVGVAMETSGVTFVTSGKKRESLMGPATLELYPHFKSLEKHCGPDFITTEVCTSKQKKFPLITFVDTPGLVDGDMKYAFDVDSAIQWLGREADMILVFFDPMGQALCKRTLDVVEVLKKEEGAKVHLYLSKADEIELERDRHRVLMQVTQNLCKRPGLNQYGFDLGTIFLPKPDNAISDELNQIQEICKDFEKTINLTVQKAVTESSAANARRSRQIVGFLAAITGLLAVLLWGALQIAVLLLAFAPPAPLLQAMVVPGLALQVALVAFAVPLLLIMLLLKLWPQGGRLSEARIQLYGKHIKHIEKLLEQRKELYREYLGDSVVKA